MCRLLLAGVEPVEAARVAARLLERIDATCIEDVDKSMLRLDHMLRDIIRSYRYPRAYFTLGRLLANLGRYGDAESLINEAIRLEGPRVKDYMF